MKTVVIFFALVVFVSAIDVYPTKYDSIDIDAILINKRLMDNYVACLVNRGKCNEEGSVLKEVIPDALLTGCSKCNPHQRTTVEKVIKFLVHDRPEDWNTMLSVYDPEGKFRDQYGQYLEKL